ncbi:hypothetical protein NLI96_g10213 [Meripilus lineatus]|uniref:Uncharacterized protein n=1 Tax=Meripilus lineatus TaxID=2056292 RepID=A0AAD5YAA8_9APHY|nr:hypothetical protein NLI96_g10213 [Physisporinus lineatus]
MRFERVEVANIVFGALAGVAVYTFHILRIYALWGKEWRVALLVAIVGYGIPANGLPLYSWSNKASIYWFLPSALAAEILIIVLTIVKTLDATRSPPSIIVQQQLSHLLLRNGLVYFVILALTDALVLSSWSSFKHWAWNLWTFIYFTDTISAILVTRFILSLRSYNLPRSNVPGESADYTDLSGRSSPLSSIDIVGNIGAPLDHGSRLAVDSDPSDTASEDSDQVETKPRTPSQSS